MQEILEDVSEMRVLEAAKEGLLKDRASDAQLGSDPIMERPPPNLGHSL